MIIRCAWCGRMLGEKEPRGDRRVSHTICAECERREFGEYADGEEGSDCDGETS